MQDTLDNIGTSYEHDFTWLYTLETSYPIFEH